MKIASAQIKAKIGDLTGNFTKHLEMIHLASANKVDLIVFPEMSLTGYCRVEGKALAIAPSNPKLLQLKEIAQLKEIVIIVGAPIEIENQLYIGSYILMPNGETRIYTKQFLHEGEDEYYSSSFQYNPQIEIDDEVISFAICADIDHEQHIRNAKATHCSLYIPSIFFSKNGIPAGVDLLTKYAKQYSMKILSSNYVGPLWGMEAGGRSGFWDENGEIIGALDGENEGLLIVEKVGDNWIIL